MLTLGLALGMLFGSPHVTATVLDDVTYIALADDRIVWQSPDTILA